MRASKYKAPNAGDKPPDWEELLKQAVDKPGIISDAYRRFWNYSVGNQILALVQCMQREIEPGPIHTFAGWRELGRYVKKGEKALSLCMPVTVKSKHRVKAKIEESEPAGNGDGDVGGDAKAGQLADGSGKNAEGKVSLTRFLYRPHWFVLSQTEGKPYVPAELPEWSESHALGALGVERIPFHHTDGNTQGYAVGRQIAVSPLAFMPARTLLHELAHVVLGHTGESHQMDDDDSATPRELREVEAECVALICCASLHLGGYEFSRGYVQHWLGGQRIPERSAQKIFKAADQILRAGRVDGGHASADPREG